MDQSDELTVKEKQIVALTRLLATERDAFGKREIELMAQIKELVEAAGRVIVVCCEQLQYGLHQTNRDKALRGLKKTISRLNRTHGAKSSRSKE